MRFEHLKRLPTLIFEVLQVTHHSLLDEICNAGVVKPKRGRTELFVEIRSESGIELHPASLGVLLDVAVIEASIVARAKTYLRFIVAHGLDDVIVSASRARSV